jgi:hypothetical protein
MAVGDSAVNAVLKEFIDENPNTDAKAARITDSDRKNIQPKDATCFHCY